MKLLTLAVAAMASVALASNASECRKWHPKIYGKINWFCAKTNIVVPSAYASRGVGVTNTGQVWVASIASWGRAGCQPPQWVPSSICRAQFYKECAAHSYMAWYGKNLCQAWYITYAPGATKPYRAADGSMWYIPLKKREADADPLALPMAEADPDVKKYRTQAEAEAAGIALHKADPSYTAASISSTTKAAA